MRWCFLSALLLVGCGEGAVPVAQPPNVLLISIDSLRADHLGSYGYERDTSPNLDRLAQEGVLFAQCSSSSSWTLPAHASLFTGLPISSHGCTASASLADPRHTLAEAMRDGGYRTAGFWSGPYLHPRFGLHQGFDEYVNCASFDFEGKQLDVNKQSHADITNPKIVEEVERWFETRPEGPFFMFVHMWDVHFDYIPPAPYDTRFSSQYDGPIDGTPPRERLEGQDLEQLIALYDGEIAWTDHHVGRLLELLSEQGVEDDTLVIVTSDHGEEFYEHGEFGHRKTLFEESIAVPLLIRYPRALPAGVQVETPTSLMDLAPTILEAAGLPALTSPLGSSLLPLMHGEQSELSRVAVAELQQGGRSLLALKSEQWKVLFEKGRPDPVGWWDLQEDPGEQNNRVESAPSDGEAMRRIRDVRTALQELAKRHRLDQVPVDEPLPEGLEEALRGFGYLGDEE